MIEITKAYEHSAFDSAFKTIALLKNCAIQIVNKKSFAIKSNIFISVRWCKKTNMFVGDNGTSLNRDKSGITIDQVLHNSINLDKELCNVYKKLLDFCNKSEDFYNFCMTHKIILNKFKCIIFNLDLDDSMLFPIGIFSFVKSKNREGVDSIKNNKITAINISYDLNQKIIDLNNNLFKNSHFVLTKEKVKVDQYYTKTLKNYSDNYFIHKKFSIKKDKFKTSYFKSYNKNKEKYKNYFFIQEIINLIIEENFVDTDCLIVYDESLQKFIKLKKVTYNGSERELNKDFSFLPVLL